MYAFDRRRVCFLTSNLKITEALRRYGISNTSTDVIVVRIDTTDATALDIESKAKSVIKGRLASLDELSAVTDWNSIKKASFHSVAISGAKLLLVLQAKHRARDQRRRTISSTDNHRYNSRQFGGYEERHTMTWSTDPERTTAGSIVGDTAP